MSRPRTRFVRPRFLSCVTGLILALMALGPAADLAAAEPATIGIEFALYFSPAPTADPAQELRRLLADPERKLTLGDAPASAGSVATVKFKWSPLADYAPPTAQSMRYFGVGVAPEEAGKLAEAERVFILLFTAPVGRAFATNRAAGQLMADLARATGGRIWDEETRQLYSVARWQADRMDTWQGGLPDLTKHVTMHAYASPDLLRIITLGMRKFGLPDLVITGIPSQHSRPVGNFINALMQRLAEGQKPEGAQMELKLSEIRHAGVRGRSLEKPGTKAVGAVLVSVKAVPLEEGDAPNTLWKLDFPGQKLKESSERAMAAMQDLFGSTDSMIQARTGDAELKEASERARKAFFAQEARFRTGLASNEHVVVKAPFSQGDQTEYMWVEVVKWREKEIEGLLTSDPYYVKSLHTGSRVTVALADVYDYILYKADGTQEGNESGKVLERMQP